jgi:hypothetical protein
MPKGERAKIRISSKSTAGRGKNAAAVKPQFGGLLSVNAAAIIVQSASP